MVRKVPAPTGAPAPARLHPARPLAQVDHSFSKVQWLLTRQRTGYCAADHPRRARLIWCAAPLRRLHSGASLVDQRAAAFPLPGNAVPPALPTGAVRAAEQPAHGAPLFISARVAFLSGHDAPAAVFKEPCIWEKGAWWPACDLCLRSNLSLLLTVSWSKQWGQLHIIAPFLPSRTIPDRRQSLSACKPSLGFITVFQSYYYFSSGMPFSKIPKRFSSIT